jgi:hypothetical protein
MNTAKTKPIEHDEITGEVIEAQVPALMETSMVATLVKAELDTQITTARTYPRSLKGAIDNIMSLATLDEQTAADCMYAMPRGGKPIRGPSIRLAEIIAQQWGNCRVEARVIQTDRVNKVITAEGTFHDLETNSAMRSVVQRRISDKRGRLFNDDMIVVTGNAACSIARRNAVLAGVPKAVWRKAYEASEQVVAGDIKTLATRREAAIKAFGTYGVKPEQVFGALDVESIDDITLEHIPALQGMFSALKNGEATVEEMFDARRSASARAFDVVSNPLKDEPQASPASTPVDDKVGEGGGEQGSESGASALSAAREEASADPAAADETAAHLKLIEAFKRGQQAKSAGHQRKAIPPEYREADQTRAALCWQAGYDGGLMPEFGP